MRVKFSLLDSLNVVSFLAAFLIVTAVIFGGASQRHDVHLALVELSAIPLLCLAIYNMVSSGIWRTHRALLSLTAAIVAVPLLQLIPLPPSLWTALPGREPSRLALELLGQEPIWRPISLTPDATRGALWALTPPVAMLLAMLVLDSRSRLTLGALFVAGAVASIMLSGAQIAVGGEGLYLYPHSRAGEVNGFSANRNHLATFVLMGLPIAAALGTAPFWIRSTEESTGRWLFGLYAALAIIAIGLTRSRTGIVLAGPVLIASLVLIWQMTHRTGATWKTLGLATLAASGVAAVAAFGLGPILDRFETMQDGPDARFDAWPTVIQAGNTVQPWGAGLGAFDPLFRSVEPLSDLGPQFFNRAHNDYLELWLETGILGVALIALALVWFVRNWAMSWTASGLRQAPVLARAAGVSVLVVVVHSLVDYPLRTETIAVFLAFCLGALSLPQPAHHARS